MSKLSEYSKFDHLDVDDSDDDIDVVGGAAKLPPTKTTQMPNESIRSSIIPPSTAAATTTSSDTASAAVPAVSIDGARMVKDEKHSGRFVFTYNGRPIYSWEQSLDNVTIYVTAPPTITKANQINCILSPRRLQLGIKNHTSWYLNEDTWSIVDVSESVWSLEDDDDDNNIQVITIYLTKSNRGVLWEAALKGNPNAANATTISSRSLNAGAGAAKPNTNTTTPTAMLDPMLQEQVKKELMLERFQEEHPGYDFRDAEFNGSIPDARTFMGGVKYD